jgi:hypothetical protein
MKIQYGIAGFAIGILLSLLIAIVEMKIMKHLQQETITPFLIGLTVIGCALAGIIIGVRVSKGK